MLLRKSVFALVALVLCLAALQQSPGAAPETPTAAIDKTKTLGGKKPAGFDTLQMHYHEDPDYINPLLASDTVSQDFFRWVYEPLAEPDYHNPDVMAPRLAEKWEFNEKTLEYTIHLRKGVKWHPMKLPNGKMLDAKEFTARDVKFTFDCILNSNILAAHHRSYYEDPEATDASQKYKIKVTVVDNYTVKIKWNKPYFLAEMYSLYIEMIPRHVFSVDENGKPISFDFGSKEFANGFNTHWANRQMCGTGPMQFKSWKQNDRVELTRFSDYWGAPFYFSDAVFRSVSNTNTARQMVLNNELDWVIIPEKDLFLELKKHPSVTSGKVKPNEFNYPGFRYIGYNQKREFFKDRRVRQALAHAMDVDSLIQNVFKGLATRTTGIALKGSTSYDESLPEIKFDLDKARALLDEAGWKDSDNNGVRDKVVDGQKLDARYDLMIFSESQAFQTIAEHIKENGKKVGIDVVVSPAKWALMLQKLRKKEFDACMLGWALDWKSDPFQLWHSSQADVPDSSNHISYKNPELDKLIDELRVTLDLKKQTVLFHKIHKLIYDEQPYTFLFSELRTAAYDARIDEVHNYKIRPCIDAREWTASKSRAMP